MRPHQLLARTLACTLTIVSAAGFVGRASTAEELMRREQVRQRVADALALYQSPTDSGDVRNDNLVRAVHDLAAVGPEAVPFLVNELTQAQPPTFLFSVYALGLIGDEAAEQALREAVRTAEAQTGNWAELRKAWACWALALMGRADGLDLMNEGQHLSAHAAMHGNLSVLEAGALFTAPESAAHLLRQLERYDDSNDPQYLERITVLKALGYVGHPATLAALAKISSEGEPMMRREAATALGGFDSPAAIEALLAALGDEDLLVRRGAALGLKLALPVGRLDPVVARLPLEDSAVLRGLLYEIVARAGGAAYTDLLLAQWGREDAMDRAQLVAVFPQLDPAKVRPILREALDDPDASVRGAAVDVAARSADPQVRTWLVEAVVSPFWTLAQAAIERLGALREVQAGEPIARRLIDVELQGVVTDPRQRDRVQKLGQALLALRDARRLDALRQAAARQQDGLLVQYLAGLIAQLDTIVKLGDKPKRWIEAVGASDPATRRLAYDFLERHPSEQATAALVAAFGRVEPSEGVDILRALGRAESKAARELVERVLLGPEFDPIERAPLRDMAAWTARRMGPSMLPTLLSAVERRDGRDTLPLVYLAVLGGERAIPTLDRTRAARLRFIKWSRGAELTRLDWIRRQLAHGRPISEVDRPPEEQRF